MILLVLGAGVEKSEGINMPIAKDLYLEVVKFLEGVDLGQKIDSKIRRKLNIKFSYTEIINEFIKKLDKISIRYENQDLRTIFEAFDIILRKVKALNLEEDEQKKIKQAFKLIKNLMEKNQKRKRKKEEIEEIDENLVKKLGYAPFVSKFIQEIFKLAIKSDESIAEELKRISWEHLDLENLLLKYFIGFYNENKTDIKRYLYVSWTMWAFFVWKEKQIKDLENLPFYSNLPKDKIGVITFNYTTFAKKWINNPIYFHGSIDRYIENYEEEIIEDYEEWDKDKLKDKLLQFIEEKIINGINFDKGKYILPSIIPPLKLKPVISSKYIETWYNAKKLIDEASKIIIIGYSFSHADEHFNDLIRKNRNKNIIIINPDLKTVIKNTEKIFLFNQQELKEAECFGKKCRLKDNLMFIEAKATEIDINEVINKNKFV